MTASTRAWMLDVSAGWHIAVGSRHVIEYLLSPEAAAVPLAPVHCRGMLVWHDRLIPLVDLAPLLDTQQTIQRDSRRAVILGYRDSPRQPVRYGALVVRTAPTDVTVSDDMACPLPEEPAVIQHLCRSCFVYRDEIVPILDTTRLFSQPLPVTLLPADCADEENVHDYEPERQQGSMSPVGEFPAVPVRAGSISLFSPGSAISSPAGGCEQPAKENAGCAGESNGVSASAVSTDKPTAAAHTLATSTGVMHGTEGLRPASNNPPTGVIAPISEPETNIPETLSADSAATIAAKNGVIVSDHGGSVLHTGLKGTERSMARLSSSVARAEALASRSRTSRASEFRESLERFNALRDGPSPGVRRRTVVVVVAAVILAGAAYGGLVWKSHPSQASDTSRQTPTLQPASPRPEPVSVPSAPVQPPN